MPTLIVAAQRSRERTGGTVPLNTEYERRLCGAARATGWAVLGADRDDIPDDVPDPVVYVTTELAVTTANALDLALLEPPFDALARVPDQFLRRRVEAATFADLARLRKRTFVKPADPLDKWFDAGLYSDVRDIRTPAPCGLLPTEPGATPTTGRLARPHAPVLLSEPVEWSAEFRYFVLDGEVVAGSPYLAHGRPVWRRTGTPAPVPAAGRAVAERLCAAMADRLPPALVVDVGLIEERGWAVVEFNPVWSAGLLSSDPRAVLPALRRATRRRTELTASDRRWDLRR